MRIDLIQPRFPLSLWDFSLCQDLDGHAFPHAPLALPTLAALTPPGHDVRLFDENVAPLPATTDAELVGITGYHLQLDRVLALATAHRRAGRRVVIGGPVAGEANLGVLLAHADHVFVGEAEYTWPRFIRDLTECQAVPPALIRQEGLIDLADSPPPRFDLLPRGYAAATIETSRGCPYACEFCEIPSRLGARSRVKSVAQVLAEVRHHHALGARSIFFVDDNFLGQKHRARELLTALAEFGDETGHAVFFSCQFTINLAKDDVLLELLARANFRRVFIGLETPRRDSLALAKKKQNLAIDPIEAVHRLHAHNIIVWAGLIVGFDTDDAAIFDDQLAFLEAAGVPVAMIGRLQAIPNTPLHTRMDAAGRLRPDAGVGGVRGPYASLITSNIEPTCMPEAALARGTQRLVRDAYAPEAYARRVLKAVLTGGRPVARSSRRPGAAELAIVARAARWFLLTRDARRRRLFLDVVGTVLRKRPEQLAVALMHLVVWKHLSEFYGRVAALPVPDDGSPAEARDLPIDVVVAEG